MFLLNDIYFPRILRILPSNPTPVGHECKHLFKIETVDYAET